MPGEDSPDENPPCSDYAESDLQSDTSFGSQSLSVSITDVQKQVYFQQQRAEVLQSGRTSSWSHRMSFSVSVLTLVTDDNRSNILRSSQVPFHSVSSLFGLPASDHTTLDEHVPIMPKRSCLQLFMNCMLQFGLEFVYSIETALVTPILLQLGLPNVYYSITWLASPILGIIFTPFIGSASDNCHLRWGRRRPFILTFFIGLMIGQTLLLNGGDIGVLLGDSTAHTFGLVFTLIGAIVLDVSINCGGCPARAYIVDVCNPEDAQFAFILRSFLGGLGGSLGYIINGIDWESTPLGVIGHQERIIFTICTVVCCTSFLLNLTSIPETPLKKSSGDFFQDCNLERKPLLRDHHKKKYTPDFWRDESSSEWSRTVASDQPSLQAGSDQQEPLGRYNTLPPLHDFEIPEDGTLQMVKTEPNSILVLFISVVKMPKELYLLCFNNFLGWMAFLVVILFFTDYMGQAVYRGDPRAPEGSYDHERYDDGVQTGSWGLCIFQFTCAVTAGIFSRISSFVGVRTAYVFGQLIFAVGTGIMALLKDSVVGTMLMFAVFGVQFFILLTLPTVLVARYHQSEAYVNRSIGHPRGIGVDLACLGVQVFFAQVIVSTVTGPLISFFQSHLVIIFLSSSLGFCTAIFSALFIVYDIDNLQKPIICH